MNEKINIRDLVFKLLSRWQYFIITAAIVLPLAYGYTKLSDKIYSIKASLLLQNEQKNDLSGKEFLKGMELFSSQTALEDEIGILHSYSMIERAINDLDFGVSYFSKELFRTTEEYGDSPLIVELDSSANQIIEIPIFIKPLSDNQYHIMAKGRRVDAYNYYTRQVEDHFDEVVINQIGEIGKPFSSKYLGFTLRFDDLYKPSQNRKYYFVVHDLNTVVEDYREKLKIEPLSRESNIVELSMRGKLPHKTISFMDKLLEVYLKNELSKKNQLGIKTIQFIDNQLSGVSDSLKRVEGWLESFRIKSNVQDINTTAENLSKNLDRLETDKADLEVKLKYYSYISSSLTEGRLNDVVAPSTFGLEDPLLSSLLIELSKLNQEKAGLNYNAKEQNPLAEVVDLKIRNTKKTLLENVNNIIDVSSIAINDLDERILRTKRSLGRLPQNERELVNIQRKFDFSDNVYNYLLEKRAEAGIAIASNSIQKTVVDSAKVNGGGPVFPNGKIIYSIAILFCLGFPVGLIIMKDILSDHITTLNDIERVTEIPVIGSVTHGSKLERTNVALQRRSLLAESFQAIRVNLQYLTLGKERSVIGFTSSVGSEGKTFCALNLASSIAQSGKKTILIDADMRKPGLSRYFKLDKVAGLSSYLVGNCSLEEIILPVKDHGLYIISSGPIPPNPLDLIGLPQMSQLIETLKQSFDTIIIDSPPIGYVVADYIILMKYTDANIYVVRSGYTSRFHLDKINRLFEDKKVKNVSILLNDVKVSRLNGYNYAYKNTYRS